MSNSNIETQFGPQGSRLSETDRPLRINEQRARELGGSLSGAHAASPFDQDLFYSAPATETTDNGEAISEEPLHPPDFKPFFTLIEDPETGAYHHPTVQYIFSDDDPDILTSALLDTLEGTTHHAQPDSPSGERCIIIDVAADGKTVTSASSLSPEWQALKTKVSLAPSWGNDASEADRGPMLKISGQHVATRLNAKSEKAGGSTSMEAVLEAYYQRLAKLDVALDRGGEDE